ncbi:prolipoprotein diacylglyceryl transferase [Tissierella carlieri]|uniref:Phosphatidylglycerol--prolipoprotein diacylglyceryl transferase n=1 Tax=Tissierella carlieri TaxID=689904 RepID=A0ABT1SE24_9FIRM|nr:prolipoprotein diacylglyceryl transferase [Tissierella carlieri]MBU5313489.1 prolipoprotein diacylglyceryl transferase [Tissierella carlieri]MCQ4924723.1 prolipoprotein diacylglyceryl transferase [Tissierella carlieri]
MKTILNISHYSINVFGLFIAIGIIVGYLITMKEAKRKEFSTDTISDLIFYVIIFGIIGARLYYVLVFNLDYYLNNPNKIIAIWDGGLSIQGALIGGGIAALVYSRRKEINLWRAADIMGPGTILGQAIGRVGCDVFGIAMKNKYFWGVLRGSELLHPAQMYESVLNYILFGILWARRKSVKYDGQLFFTYLIGFSINRFIVEFFRANPIFIKPLTVAHATSVILIIISIIALRILKKKGNNSDNINETRIFSINVGEIAIILSMIIVSLFLYYNWIWR